MLAQRGYSIYENYMTIGMLVDLERLHPARPEHQSNGAADPMRRLAKVFRAQVSALGKYIRKITRSDERVARQSLERARLIARDLRPACGYDVKTTILKQGRRTRLYLHEVFSTHGNSALKIVEKRTNNHGENAFFRTVRQKWPRPQDCLTPEIYFIRNNPPLALSEFRNHFFIEHIPSIGLPDLSEATAANLAKSMIRIANIPIGSASDTRHARKRFDESFLENFVRTVIDDGLVGDVISQAELANMKSDWRLVLERDLTSSRLVPCHNDLHPLNLGRRDFGRNNLVFIDWELFALNHLGSDLHHFISLGIIRSDWSNFSNIVHNQYCDLAERTFGARRRDVDFAACSYTLYRCMRRVIRQRKDIMQVRTCVALLERLRAIPYLVAGVVLGEAVHVL